MVLVFVTTWADTENELSEITSLTNAMETTIANAKKAEKSLFIMPPE
jgi:hypothetical protein